MLTVAEALALVLANVSRGPTKTIPLAEALGCVLAEDVAADVDSPPHDKTVVDGYAMRFEDLVEGCAELQILEEVTAGQVPSKGLGSMQATRIMTGAPIPDGADVITMVERTTLVGGDHVRIIDPKLTRGRNIVRRGASMRVGDVVLKSGTQLRPSTIGLLAEVGRATATVYAAPRVAVLVTGNELVAAHEKPGPGQIRNSNGPMLTAMVDAAGAVPIDLGVGRDERDDLRAKIAAGLAADVLILSGGVSAGVLDLVPGVLAELGVREVFHKVSVKPGKPIWFGLYEADGRAKPVFGLPGNPVSGLVCFELFVRPAILAMEGFTDVARRTVKARLAKRFVHQGDRPTYWPAVREAPGDAADSLDSLVTATPLAWHGSGDLRGIVPADCLICFPSGDKEFAAGDVIEIWPLYESARG